MQQDSRIGLEVAEVSMLHLAIESPLHLTEKRKRNEVQVPICRSLMNLSPLPWAVFGIVHVRRDFWSEFPLVEHDFLPRDAQL